MIERLAAILRQKRAVFTLLPEILAEVQRLARETGTALIWITHDLSVIAGLADTVSVMYAGKIVEQGGPELADKLEANGYAVQWQTYAMEHSVHPHEIVDIGNFLRRVLNP